jgi:hypothetical protein
MKFFLLLPPHPPKKKGISCFNHNGFLHFQYDVNTHNPKKKRKEKKGHSRLFVEYIA